MRRSTAKRLRAFGAWCVGLALALPLTACGADAGAATHGDEAAAQEASAPAPAAPAPEHRQRPERRPAAAARDAALEADLAALLDAGFVKARTARKGKLSGADVQISVSVRDAVTGAVLADLRADRSLRPASNLKLVTAAAGLYLLGPTGTFDTRYELGGEVADGTLRGDLVVRGGGDPIVRDGSFGAVEAYFDVLASKLDARGIDRIAGDLVLDEGDFLEPAPGPSWPSADQHWKDYCALAAGLTINAGVIEAVVRTRPGASRADVAVHPWPAGLPSDVDVRQVNGTINDVRVGATVSRLTVGGKIGRKLDGIDAAFRHPDPVAYFGAVLEARLAAHGIQVDGAVRRERGAPGGEHLVTVTSPITDSLVPINTHSNNSVADQLFFKLGHDFGGGGTRAGGEGAVRLALERLGVPTAGLEAVDGSGLSRDNRVSPAQLTALLWAVLHELDTAPSAGLFRDSLAVMGRTGTLDGRMRGTPADGAVFAKTGFIAGTSSLAGWLQTTSGRGIVFSIMVNYPSYGGLNNSAWKPMQNDMVLRLLDVR